MKLHAVGVAAVAAVVGVAGAHTTYLDPFGLNSDVHPFFINQGFNHLDLVATEVHNHGNHFHFEVLVNANIQATDWGKFLIYFDTAPGGRTDNPWGRNITTANEANFFIGGWADGGGGAELYQATPGGWNLVDASYLPGSMMHVHLDNAVAGVWELEFNASIMGVVGGQLIGLDVVTTAGGTSDPGVDHLSLSTFATPDWGTGSVSGPFLDYVVEPTPGSLAVMGIAGLLAGRRRRA